MPEFKLARVIDTHHHLWDLTTNHYEWLVGQPIDFHIGPYEKIRRDYLPTDYLRDIQNQNVIKSVHVEAGIDPADPVRETEWLQAQADRHGFPHAIVAYANLAAPDVHQVLERHRRFPNVRGIRMLNRKIGELHRTGDSGRSVMSDSCWRRGFRLLADLELSFDLQAPPPIMHEAADVAAAFPDVPIALTHAGLPLDRTREGMAAWRKGMRLLAERPNVVVKISGLPMTDWHWTVDSLRPVVLETIDIFGTKRAMFGSNFPIDSLYSDYDTLLNADRAILSCFSGREQAAILHDNAQRFYRLQEAQQPSVEATGVAR